jgi:hypothetical protein
MRQLEAYLCRDRCASTDECRRRIETSTDVWHCRDHCASTDEFRRRIETSGTVETAVRPQLSVGVE